MIVLRRKITGKEQIFIPSYFNKNKIDFSQYEILKWDVVELVWGNEEEISEGWYDIERAKEKIDKSSPTMNYRLKDVPRPDLNLIPKNSPNKEHKILHNIIIYSGTWLVNKFNKIKSSIVLTIITVIGTVIGTLLAIAFVNLAHGKGFTL